LSGNDLPPLCQYSWHPLNGVSVRLSGTVDLRSFFNVDEGVRPGYQGIEAEAILDSPALTPYL